MTTETHEPPLFAGEKVVGIVPLTEEDGPAPATLFRVRRPGGFEYSAIVNEEGRPVLFAPTEAEEQLLGAWSEFEGHHTNA